MNLSEQNQCVTDEVTQIPSSNQGKIKISVDGFIRAGIGTICITGCAREVVGKVAAVNVKLQQIHYLYSRTSITRISREEKKSSVYRVSAYRVLE